MSKLRALKDLNKEELLTFIYNHPPGDVNIFDPLALCGLCGEHSAKGYYVFQCQDCIDAEGPDDEVKERNWRQTFQK